MADQQAYAERWAAEEGHAYEPATEVDRITGQYPCRRCGRFKGSALHQADSGTSPESSVSAPASPVPADEEVPDAI